MSILVSPGGAEVPLCSFPALASAASTTQPLVTPAALKNALNRVRQEFEFNISAVHHFNVSLTASKSLGEVALDIMEGVHTQLEPTRRVLGIFTHVSICAIIYIYIK